MFLQYNLFSSPQQFIEDRVYDDGDPDMCNLTSTVGDSDIHATVRQRQNQSRGEVESEFAVKASVALQAGEKFLADNFEQIRVSQDSRQFQVTFFFRVT